MPYNTVQPIVGYNGTLKVGSGIAQQEMPWGGEWEIEAAFDVAVFGPFIGDKGKKYPVKTGVIYKGSIKGTIPKGSSPALNAIKYAVTSGGDSPAIELSAIDGDWYQFLNPAIESFKSSLKADGSHEFELKWQSALSGIGQNPA